MSTSQPAPLRSEAPLIGVEFTDWPLGTVDLLPRADSAWQYTTANGSAAAAPTDSRGWPLINAYVVIDYLLPSQLDPLHPMPVVHGAFSLIFNGRADLVLGPTLNISIVNASFDAGTWTTTATLLVQPNATLPGIAVGFFNSQRNSTSPVNTGVTNVRILQPGYSLRDIAGVGAVTNTTLAALAPFAHARMMSYTYNNWPLFYNASGHGLLSWDDRRHGDDALWVDGIPNERTFGAPWESVITLAQQCKCGSWNAVPVQATGGGGAARDNSSSYVWQLAALLLNGSTLTRGAGVPGLLYIQHGNEVYYNFSASLVWNTAAAEDEVARGVAPWNTPRVDDAYVWNLRRHVSRLYDIAATFAAVWRGAARARVRVVLDWDYNAAPLLASVLQWHADTFGMRAADWLYGVAINTYRIAYFSPGVTPSDIFAAMTAQTDAQRPLRAAVANVTAAFGVRMLAYEGNTICVPAQFDAPTFATCIQANRLPGAADVMTYDFDTAWAPLGGAEYNYYALATQYDEYQWGLTDDMRNLTTVKWTTAAAIAAGKNASSHDGGAEAGL